MKFLDELSDQISSQFSLGENSDRQVNLGDYAGKIDKSEERRYTEEGYLRRDPFNTDSKKFDILIQEPDASVMIKKRMFSSIGENYRPDYMDKDEKIYYRSMKLLFQNKCVQISALEKLSKIQKVTDSVGRLDTQLVPMIITLADTLSDGLGVISGDSILGSSNGYEKSASAFTKTIDKLRKIYAFNTPTTTTNWVTDPTSQFRSQFGDGTGVIEITNFTDINTTVSTELGKGSINFNIVDPYKAMLITDYDIERAIADATNSFYNHKSFQLGLSAINQTINDLTNQLNAMRDSRNASRITIKVNPDTLLYKRVIAIVDQAGKEIIFDYDSSGGSGFPGLGSAANAVSISPDYYQDGEILGYNGLSNLKNVKFPNSRIDRLIKKSELIVFKDLISAIYNKLQLEANSKNAFQVTNQDTNYSRRKLRFNFSGKTIIQPMDTVHVYMNSKSRFDGKLLTGVNNMFSGVGILQNLNNTITDFKNTADSLMNPSGNVSMQAEKSVYVGSTFPNFLWSMLRRSIYI